MNGRRFTSAKTGDAMTMPTVPGEHRYLMRHEFAASIPTADEIDQEVERIRRHVSPSDPSAADPLQCIRHAAAAVLVTAESRDEVRDLVEMLTRERADLASAIAIARAESRESFIGAVKGLRSQSDVALALIREYAVAMRKAGARHISPAMRAVVMDRDGHECTVKGCESRTGLQIDHIKPFSEGGMTVPANLQVLCAKHNASKGARDVDEWAASKGLAPRRQGAWAVTT